MSKINERRMKKYAPYQSLVDHTPAVELMKREKLKCEKPIISQEQAESIDYILTNYEEGTSILFTYYENGFIKKMVQQITKIDLNKRMIFGSEKNFKFNQIINLENY